MSRRVDRLCWRLLRAAPFHLCALCCLHASRTGTSPRSNSVLIERVYAYLRVSIYVYVFFWLARRTVDRDLGRTRRLHRQRQHDKLDLRYFVQSGTARLHFVEPQRRGKPFLFACKRFDISARLRAKSTPRTTIDDRRSSRSSVASSSFRSVFFLFFIFENSDRTREFKGDNYSITRLLVRSINEQIPPLVATEMAYYSYIFFSYLYYRKHTRVIIHVRVIRLCTYTTVTIKFVEFFQFEPLGNTGGK